MELTHQFTVPASLDVAWAAFNDLERIAPCFPGASVTSFDGEAFEGICKVKLGPISLQYAGSGRFVERDETAHRVVIEAKGRDKRGNGTAAANVTGTLTAAGDDRTDVSVTTDLNITGRPAQFGRGVMQDVSDKLLGEFASCLESKLATTDDTSAAEPEPAAEEAASTGAAASAAPDTTEPAADDAAAPVSTAEAPGETPLAAKAAAAVKSAAAKGSGAAADASGTQEPAASSTQPRSTLAEPAAAAELDLGATVLPVLLRRYAPRILVAVLVLLVLRKLLRRR